MIFPFLFFFFLFFPFSVFFLFKLKTDRRLRDFSLGSSIDFPSRRINEVLLLSYIGELLPNPFRYIYIPLGEKRNRSYLSFVITDGDKGLPRKKISLAKKTGYVIY